MKKTLNIGSIRIPKSSATKGFGFIGKRGSGKSYGAAVFAEEMFRSSIPFVVFDPIDVWWGMKVAADGKGKGLPVVVFGKEHADVQLNRTMGKRIAEAVVKHNISCVISTFGMNKTEMRELIADFSERLLQINNTPRQVIIEEAHEFVPQRVMGAMARCFSAVEALLVMGRNRGIGVSLLNQRMATINKDLLTQIDVLVAFRSVGPQDRKAFRDWVEVHNEDHDARFDEFMRSVPSLPTGTAWVWSPEFLEKFERVKFRKRETFHPDRERLGMTFKMPEIKQGDVQSFIEAFNKKPEEKRGTVITLKRAPNVGFSESTRRELEREEKKMLADEYRRGYGEGEMAGVEKGRAAQEKVDRVHIRRLEAALHQVQKASAAALGVKIEIEKVRVAAPRIEVPADPERFSGEPKKLVGGGIRMLSVLARRYPMKFTRSQLALQSDMKARGGGFGNYLAIIKGNGWATEHGGFVQATEEGITEAGVSPEAPGSPEELRAMWRERLTGKGKDMFDVICDHHPMGIARVELAAMVGMEERGGGFGNYLATMKSNGLITIKDGAILASDDLFRV